MTDGPAGGTSPAHLARHALTDVWSTVRRADLAIVYCAVVLLVAVVLWFLSPEMRDQVYEDTSTNLVNLRDRPLSVLIASAFVISTPGEVLLVLQLLVVLAYAQRFVGRLASLAVGFMGHVGATVCTAVVLTTGIFHGFVNPSVATVDDVGVSYVMASVMGFLTVAVPRRWRWWWIAFVVLYWVAPGLVTQSFTAVGHTTALVVGLTVAFVAGRTRQAPGWTGDIPGR
ncbi:hypothetical protein H9623_18685 [Oerskovia sp. Sa1BUA8]|uniref:Uncharacterized protein n=1 Tax=Oerskovia douganii TaxID=2762210 RepID=A0A9D5Z0S5_9CELL|nr:rhomboid-like protein [Oerskovia douganii]MBE7702322.1 hypothetical protein [Oerskovia douganii]